MSELRGTALSARHQPEKMTKTCRPADPGVTSEAHPPTKLPCPRPWGRAACAGVHAFSFSMCLFREATAPSLSSI